MVEVVGSTITAMCHHTTASRPALCVTCRPLIVQMVHDPTAQEPRCRLQDEDSEEYGPPIIPETAIADAILKRTQDHLRQLGNVSVSSKPIVMRAE
jgi:hypothetical protein